MKSTLAIGVCILFIFVFGSFSLTLEKRVDNFTLRNVNGKNVSTQDYKDAKGFIVIFTCNHCPFAKLYTNRFNELNTKVVRIFYHSPNIIFTLNQTIIDH